MLQYEQIGVNPKPMQIPPNVIHCRRSQQARVPPRSSTAAARTQASCLRRPLLLQHCLRSSGRRDATQDPARAAGLHMQKARGAGCTTQGFLLRGTCVQPAVLYQSKQSAQPCKSCGKTASKQSPRAKGSQTNTRKHKHNTLAFQLY